MASVCSATLLASAAWVVTRLPIALMRTCSATSAFAFAGVEVEVEGEGEGEGELEVEVVVDAGPVLKDKDTGLATGEWWVCGVPRPKGVVGGDGTGAAIGRGAPGRAGMSSQNKS